LWTTLPQQTHSQPFPYSMGLISSLQCGQKIRFTDT
jgi:hypothetical protein